MVKILIADDDVTQRFTTKLLLERMLGAEVEEAVDGAEALQKLNHASGSTIALLLLDLYMPLMGGMEVLQALQHSRPNLPVIVLTGSEETKDAVAAMQLGAMDFLTKPANPDRLVTSVRNALAMRELKEKVRTLAPESLYDFHQIDTPSLHDAITLGRKASQATIPVLITGESGTGKEIFARAIHRASIRAEKPFVAVNCGALPEPLVESILFGHEKGAFTGAVSKSLGKCREAHHGVLFLDEIGELKADAQVKLLRLLQEGEIEPVGAARPVQVDVRVISATHQNLEEAVAQGRFREDLYYRLHGLPLHLPALRERRDDILPLAHKLLGRIAATEDRTLVPLSPAAESWMQAYHWPGNIRQLQQVLARGLLLCNGSIIEKEDLSRWTQSLSAPQPHTTEETITLLTPDGRTKTLEIIEQEAIILALKRHHDHIGQTAAALGIGQSTLYKKMKR
jgi:DNA-binding NtrC family response regulator